MPDNLERLLDELGRAPVDTPLDGVSAGVNRRIAEARAASVQTWRLRLAATLVLAASGAAVSGAMTANAAVEASPFDAWSALAPSSLLE